LQTLPASAAVRLLNVLTEAAFDLVAALRGVEGAGEGLLTGELAGPGGVAGVDGGDAGEELSDLLVEHLRNHAEIRIDDGVLELDSLAENAVVVVGGGRVLGEGEVESARLDSEALVLVVTIGEVGADAGDGGVQQAGVSVILALDVLHAVEHVGLIAARGGDSADGLVAEALEDISGLAPVLCLHVLELQRVVENLDSLTTATCEGGGDGDCDVVDVVGQRNVNRALSESRTAEEGETQRESELHL